MRIILKPGGLALLGGAFVLLVGVTAFSTKALRHNEISHVTGASSGSTKPSDKNGSMAGSKLVSGLSPVDSKTNLLSDGKAWRYSSSNQGAKSEMLSPPDSVPGTHDTIKGYRFHTIQVGQFPYGVLLKRVVPVALPKGQGYRLRFRAASPDACQISAIVELAAKPYTKALDKQFKLSKNWQEYSLPFRSIGYEAEGSTVTFFLGHSVGEIKLADVGIEKYDGPIPTSTPAPSHVVSQSSSKKKGNRVNPAAAPIASL